MIRTVDTGAYSNFAVATGTVAERLARVAMAVGREYDKDLRRKPAVVTAAGNQSVGNSWLTLTLNCTNTMPLIESSAIRVE